MATRPIVIGIQGDASRLKKALGEAEKGIKGFSKRVGKMGAKAGLAFGAAATAVGVTGVSAFADFETRMREVLTLLPNAGEETFGQLSEQVKTFSKEFGVLPTEVIPSLYQALSAGVPQDNVFEFLETAQKAAKGGATDLETAVDGITSVTNAYAAAGLSAAEASDLMFTAVRLGKTDFTQLSNSMFQVAPIASALGVEFQDVTAGLANLTAQGTPTKVAATQLKSALAELGKEGTKADIAFREMAGKGFQEYIENGGNLQLAFANLKDEADVLGISVIDMFGSIEAGQAVLGLTADDGVAFNQTLNEMRNSAGATDAAFDTMDQGLAANFDRIKANIEVLKIEIGQRLAPLVEKATSFIVANFDNFKDIAEDVRAKIVEIAQTAFPIMVNVVETAVDIFKKHLMPVLKDTWKVMKTVGEFVNENRKEFIFLASVVAGALVGFKAFVAFKKLLTFLAAIKKSVLAMNAAMLANPIGIVVVAIAALVAALTYAYFESEKFRNLVNKIFFFIKDELAPIFSDVLGPVVKAVIDVIVDRFKKMWNVVDDVIGLIKAIFTGDWSTALDKFKSLAANTLRLVFDLFLGIPKKITMELLPKMATALIGLIKGPFEDFQHAAFRVTDKIVGFFKGLPTRLGLLVKDFANVGIDLMGSLMKGMLEGIAGAGKWVAGLATDVGNAIIEFVNDNIIKKFNDLVQFDFSILGKKINIDPPDIPPIPKLANGGIVQGRQLALLGDNPSGTELVLPLERASSMGFGGTTVNINVQTGVGDPTKIGAEILSYLKQWERMNGSLPITTS